jgi:hypothetical protein
VFLAVRQTWSQDRVFFLDEQGRQFSLPVREKSQKWKLRELIDGLAGV